MVCMQAFVGICEMAAAITIDDPCQILLKGSFNGRATNMTLFRRQWAGAETSANYTLLKDWAARFPQVRGVTTFLDNYMIAIVKQNGTSYHFALGMLS